MLGGWILYTFREMKVIKKILEGIRLCRSVVGFLVIPAIPGIVLWFFLHPATFWQKLAWFVVSLILYVVMLGLEAKILD